MPSSTPTRAHWATTDAGLWHRWRGYSVRWLLLGEIVQLLQPTVNDIDQYWQQKLYQALTGLIFGALCAVIFTLAENTLNVVRIKWKSWLIAVGTWMLVKVVFVSVMAATG